MAIRFLRNATPQEAVDFAEYEAGKVFRGLARSSEDRWIRRGAAVRITDEPVKKKKATKKKKRSS